ncbi:MAG: hypothetical protein RLZZ244_2399, partial [Verrucomicrobiota bacterium]
MMANSVFACPHCGLSVEAGAELFGAECQCPGCDGIFVVPSAEAIGKWTGEMEQIRAQRADLERRVEELEGRLKEAEGVESGERAKAAQALEKAEALRVVAERRVEELEERDNRWRGEVEVLQRETRLLQEQLKEAQPVVPESWAFVQGRTLTAAEGGSGMFWKVA